MVRIAPNNGFVFSQIVNTNGIVRVSHTVFCPIVQEIDCLSEGI